LCINYNFKEREGGAARNKVSLVGSGMIGLRYVAYGFMIVWSRNNTDRSFASLPEDSVN